MLLDLRLQLEEIIVQLLEETLLELDLLTQEVTAIQLELVLVLPELTQRCQHLQEEVIHPLQEALVILHQGLRAPHDHRLVVVEMVVADNKNVILKN